MADTHDVTSDGIPDLVGYAGGAVSVAVGSGKGVFEPPRRSALPEDLLTNTHALLVDLDEDGVDLAIADQLAGVVHVMRGSNDGEFVAAGAYPVGSGPVRLAGGDLNDDGARDLVSANGAGRSISVLLGRADGGFDDALTLDLWPTVPVDLATAVVEGDSLPDLFLGAQDGSVLLLRGQGDGTFEDPESFASGLGYIRELEPADVDGDGAVDVLVATERGLSVLLAGAGGTLRTGVDFPLGNTLGVEVIDLDQDGDLDVVAGAIADEHAVFLNDGAGGFSEGPRAASAARAFFDDLTGDGVPDLLFRAVDPLFVLAQGLGDGRFDTRRDFKVPGLYAVDLGLADLDADGSLDAILANPNQNTVEILAGAQDGTFSHADSVPVGPGVIAIAAGRFDSGEDVDVAVVSRKSYYDEDSANQLQLLRGAGSSELSPGATLALPGEPSSVHTGDFDGDGIDDPIVALAAPSELAQYLGREEGGLAPLSPISLAGMPGALKVADLNDDGRSDVVVSVEDHGVVVLLAGSDGRLVAGEQPPLDATGDEETIGAVRDLTNDGLPDLVTVISRSSGFEVNLRRALGEGRFAAPSRMSDLGSTHLELLDLDDNGTLDLASANEVRLGLPGGGFSPSVTYWDGAGGYLFADVNGDGRPDRLGIVADSLRVLLHR